MASFFALNIKMMMVTTGIPENPLRPIFITIGIKSTKGLLNHALPIARRFSVDKLLKHAPIF